MTTGEKENYKVCLAWPGGGRHNLTLAPNTTMKDLANAARRQLGNRGVVDGGDKSTIVMTAGFPPETLNLSSTVLARSVLPPRSRVQCIIQNNSKKRPHAHSLIETGNDDNEKTWACNVCTLLNTPSSLRCEACETDKPGNSFNEDTNQLDGNMARTLQQEGHIRTSASAVEPSSSSSPYGWIPASLELDPTTLLGQNQFWVYTNGSDLYRKEQVLGKWLIFCKEQTIHWTWNKIWPHVASGNLHAAAAKVATKFSATAHTGMYVICVYTSEARMDEVAFKLIPLIRRHISYKTDKDTSDGIYASKGAKNISKKTLYWNDGNPSFIKAAPKPRSPSKPTLELSAKQSATKAAQAPNERSESPSSHFEITLTLVGIERQNISQEVRSQWAMGETRVHLAREPTNSYDSNAIRVLYSPLLQPGSSSTTQPPRNIGYIKKEQSALLAPWLDRNLLCFESATMEYSRGKSTIDLKVTGSSCEDAKDVLAAF
jgi:hypothetical protein